jgi:hypothetical protein
MLTLIKETSTLYRVLSKILPASEIKVHPSLLIVSNCLAFQAGST